MPKQGNKSLDATMTVTDAIAIIGLVSGVAGTVLGVTSFLRDRASVDVSLQWDMSISPAQDDDPDKKYVIITVTNVGRRPIFVSHAAIQLPKANGGKCLVLMTESIAGTTLTEGSPSARYTVSQTGFEAHARYWRRVVARIDDSHGKVWYSKAVKKKPSWAIQ